MKGDRIDWLGILKEHSHRWRVYDRVSREVFHPGHQTGVLFDVESVAEQAPFGEQFVDCIPCPVHEVVDRCIHCWSAHISIVALASDKAWDLPRRVAPWPVARDGRPNRSKLLIAVNERQNANSTLKGG